MHPQSSTPGLQSSSTWNGPLSYSANTLRAQKADGAIFQAFCERRGESYLPADPKTILSFIEHQVKTRKKPATVKRYVDRNQPICPFGFNLSGGEY